MKMTAITLFAILLLAGANNADASAHGQIDLSVHQDFMMYVEPATDRGGHITTVKTRAGKLLVQVFVSSSETTFLYPGRQDSDSQSGSTLELSDVSSPHFSAQSEERDRATMEQIGTSPEIVVYAIYKNGVLVGILVVNMNSGDAKFSAIK